MNFSARTLSSNLRAHASGWPAADDLRRVVARGQEGNGIADTGPGKGSAGSDRIIAAVMKDDPRPVNIVVNSGSNTLAQALVDYRSTHTPTELVAFVAKLRVFDNGGQDDAGAWICREFPAIHWVRSVNQMRAYGGPSNTKLGPHVWEPFAYSPEGQHQWVNENVQTNHGPLGALYPDRNVGGTFHFLLTGRLLFAEADVVKHSQIADVFRFRTVLFPRRVEPAVRVQILVRNRLRFDEFVEFIPGGTERRILARTPVDVLAIGRTVIDDQDVCQLAPLLLSFFHEGEHLA